MGSHILENLCSYELGAPAAYGLMQSHYSQYFHLRIESAAEFSQDRHKVQTPAENEGERSGVERDIPAYPLLRQASAAIELHPLLSG